MLEITLEQVERIRETADVSYEEAKKALVDAGGDMLEAIILLEQQGKTGKSSGGFYSTRGGGHSSGPPPKGGGGHKKQQKTSPGSQAVGDAFRDIFDGAASVLRHSTLNHLELWRGGRCTAAIPVLILVLLFLVAFWIVLPLAVVAPFCGFDYRFSGPDLGRESINRVMKQISEGAEKLKVILRQDVFKKNG